MISALLYAPAARRAGVTPLRLAVLVMLVVAPLLLLVLAPVAGCLTTPTAGTGGVLADGGDIPAAFRPMVEQAAQANGVHPALLAGLARAESGWNPDARSPVGAGGLTQLMPATARGLGVADVYDPAANLGGGAKYLRQQLDTFDSDVDLALAAYNAGPGAVARYGGIPPFPETQQYVPRVKGYAAEYGYTADDGTLNLGQGVDVAAADMCADAAGGLAAASSGDVAVIVGDAACPIAQPHQWTDTWGAPRSGGRTHKGADIFAAVGTANYATQAGTVRFTSSPLGGVSLWITAASGDRFYYAHLTGYAPGLASGDTVTVGEVVGYVGNTGNARHTPPHTHWEYHPGGGAAVNPTAYLNAVCR